MSACAHPRTDRLAHAPTKRRRSGGTPSIARLRAALRHPSQSTSCARTTARIVTRTTRAAPAHPLRAASPRRARARDGPASRSTARFSPCGRRKPREIVHAHPAVPTRHENAIDRSHAHAGNAQQLLAGRPVHVERETLAVRTAPTRVSGRCSSGRLPAASVASLLRGESVEPHQPVRLIQPMLAHQRGGAWRQHGARIGDRAECGVVDAAQPV